MKIINCQVCGQLVAVIEAGSKVQRDAVMICRDCWGRDSEPHRAGARPGDMPEFLKGLFEVGR